MLANTGQLPVVFFSLVGVREARVGCSHLMMRMIMMMMKMMTTMVMMMVMMMVMIVM